MFSMADDEREPSAEELAEIEREWPQIARGLAVLDAEIRSLTGSGQVDELAVRRVRRAGRQVLRPVRVPVRRVRFGGDAA